MVIFFDHMRYQSQIVLNKHLSGHQITVFESIYRLMFLVFCKRLRKCVAAYVSCQPYSTAYGGCHQQH